MTGPSELRGPAGVRLAVAEFSRLWLPQHAAAAAEAWELDPVLVPVPLSAPGEPRRDAYLPREPAAIDRWPLLSVTTGRRTSAPIDQNDDGEVQIQSIHQTRVYLWVKAAGWNATMDMRDNLATVAQAMFLAHNNLDGDGTMRIMVKTMMTDYSTVEPVKGERFVAGAFVGFDLAVVETLTDRLAMPGGGRRDRVARVSADAAPHPDTTPMPPRVNQ